MNDGIRPPDPRYILVHMDKSTLDAENVDDRAHAFGPFQDYEALVDFDRQTLKQDKDTCYRIAFPLVGPEGQDVIVSAIGIALGFRQAALPLPPRETHDGPSPTDRLSKLSEAMTALEKSMRKDAKKAAKRAEKAKQAEIDKANAQDDGR